MVRHEEKFREIGMNIAYWRRQRGLTQIQLAEKAGISRTYISRIEAPNYHGSFSMQTLFDIADALDVEIEQLLRLSMARESTRL